MRSIISFFFRWTLRNSNGETLGVFRWGFCLKIERYVEILGVAGLGEVCSAKKMVVGFTVSPAEGWSAGGRCVAAGAATAGGAGGENGERWRWFDGGSVD
ncbi:hypothetical protein P3L10_017281 [Capsicum annuum]